MPKPSAEPAVDGSVEYPIGVYVGTHPEVSVVTVGDLGDFVVNPETGRITGPA
jgi:hypothetical protein